METGKPLFEDLDLFPVRSLSKQVIESLAKKHLSLAIAEGCTGGELIDNLTIPGSCSVFHAGCVLYSRQAKERFGVLPQTIQQYGEYSLPVALEMAKAARCLRNDTFSLAIVGNLDTSVSLNKPRMAYFAISQKNKAPAVQSIALPILSRMQLKQNLAIMAFSQLLSLVQNRQPPDLEKYQILPTKIISPELAIVYNQARKIIDQLTSRDLSLATMESCTGGALANILTHIPGASQVIDSSFVAYDEGVKTSWGTKVSADTWLYGGVYSEEVALAMATAVMDLTDTDIAIATTGVMDNWDTRPFHDFTRPGTIYLAILVKGLTPFVSKIVITPKPRELMKIEICNLIFHSLSVILNRLNKEDQKEFSSDNQLLIY